MPKPPALSGEGPGYPGPGGRFDEKALARILARSAEIEAGGVEAQSKPRGGVYSLEAPTVVEERIELPRGVSTEELEDVLDGLSSLAGLRGMGRVRRGCLSWVSDGYEVQ